MNEVALDAREQEELYVVLKPRENELADPLNAVLRRIEHALFQRMTVEELETLAERFQKGR